MPARHHYLHAPRPLVRPRGLGRLLVRLAVAIAAVGSWGCDDTAAPELVDGVIDGTVQAEGTGLADVQIGLSSSEGGDRFLLTDSRGAFAFGGLGPGEYRVYLGAVPGHVVADRDSATVTLSSSRSSVRADLTTRYRRDAAIVIRVEVEGQGIPALEVTVSGPESRAERTDSLGTATFEGLLHGRYTVALTDYDPDRNAFATTHETIDADGQFAGDLRFSGVEVPRTPLAPTDLAIEAPAVGRVDLRWVDRADNEELIEVARRQVGDSLWLDIGTADPDVTEWIDLSAPPGSDLEYRIRGCNRHGCSEPWVEGWVTTPEAPPVAPAELAAAATGPTTVVLDWSDTSDNELRFEIERRGGTDGVWASVGWTGAGVTRWFDGTVVGGTEYGYRMRSCNDAGCSVWTEAVQVVTVVVPPLAPADLRAVAVSHSAVELTWVDRSPDETGFRIRRRAPVGGWSDLATVPAGSVHFDDSGLTGGETYQYRVVACNTAGCSPETETAFVTTPEPPPNLRIDAAYIVQRVQRPAGDVPLVAGTEGLLRVFVVGDRSGLTAPSVRVEFLRNGSPVHSAEIAAPLPTAPAAFDESSLSHSWNLPVPSSLLQGSLALRVTADPHNHVAEHDETDNVFTVDALDIRSPPPFDVTFVPVRQSVNGAVGQVDAGSVESFLTDTRSMLPLREVVTSVHAEFTTDQPLLASNGSGWGAVLSEVAALRTAEGGAGAYYGVVPTSYGSGVAGIGYIGWPVALGWDRSGRAAVAAHEWGHNFGQRHAPGCGAANPDPAWPYADGRVGAWGWDASDQSLKSPSVHYDLMSYCGPEWISDYVYERIITAYSAAAARLAPPSGGTHDGLLVWGRIEDGRPILEPAFRVQAPASPLPAAGRYRIEGRTSDDVLFDFAFDPIPVADAPNADAHFAFVVPLPGDTDIAAELTSLTLTDGVRSDLRTAPPAGAPSGGVTDPVLTPLADGRVEVTWDASRHPMALIRDRATGQILSFARGGHVRLTTPGAEVTIGLSNGLRTVETRTLRR